MADTPAGRQREVTVTDVAHLAGVGKATAARALGEYGHVSEEKRELVLAAAERLGYRPNELARSMNTGRTRTLGVIVGDIENSYFGNATRGITDVARRAGYDVILLNTDENVTVEIEAVRVLTEKRVDAMIVSPASAYAVDHLQHLVDTNYPLVLLDRTIAGLPAPAAVIDIVPAAEEATARLIALGHRRIAFLSALTTDGMTFHGLPLGVSSVAERISGMLAALEAAGIRPDHDLLRFGAVDRASTDRILGELLQRDAPPTALVASDSTVVRDVLAALKSRSLRVPADISLVSFDDTGWEEFTDPPLTVVSQPVHANGEDAARMALRILGVDVPGPGGSAGHGDRLTAHLVERSSLGPPAS